MKLQLLKINTEKPYIIKFEIREVNGVPIIVLLKNAFQVHKMLCTTISYFKYSLVVA